jgi:hypothetical protein
MEQGGEHQNEHVPDTINELIEAGLDTAAVRQLANGYVAVLRARLANVEEDSETVIEQTFVDFEHALQDRAAVRRRVLEGGCAVDLGVSPRPGLIVLKDHGHELVPSFQFAADGVSPDEAVLELNDRLGSEVDAWAVAAWWLSPLAQLDDRSPLEELHRGGYERVVAAINNPAYSY